MQIQNINTDNDIFHEQYQKFKNHFNPRLIKKLKIISTQGLYVKPILM